MDKNLFDNWWEKRNYDNPDKLDSNDKGLAIRAFRAGMLAAANLIKPTYVTNDYEAGKEGASTIIREEIDE